MKRRGFSSSPDRAAAMRERTEREGREAKRSNFDRLCDLTRDELTACLAAGLTTWQQIMPRVRARCGIAETQSITLAK